MHHVQGFSDQLLQGGALLLNYGLWSLKDFSDRGVENLVGFMNATFRDAIADMPRLVQRPPRLFWTTSTNSPDATDDQLLQRMDNGVRAHAQPPVQLHEVGVMTRQLVKQNLQLKWDQ